MSAVGYVIVDGLYNCTTATEGSIGPGAWIMSSPPAGEAGKSAGLAGRRLGPLCLLLLLLALRLEVQDAVGHTCLDLVPEPGGNHMRSMGDSDPEGRPEGDPPKCRKADSGSLMRGAYHKTRR